MGVSVAGLLFLAGSRAGDLSIKLGCSQTEGKTLLKHSNLISLFGGFILKHDLSILIKRELPQPPSQPYNQFRFSIQIIETRRKQRN